MPYERFKAVGPKGLTNRELIAILLRSGTTEEPVLKLAGNVLQVVRNPENRLSVLYGVSLKQLMAIPGIGEVKAVRLLAMLELSERLAKENVYRKYVMNGPLICRNAEIVAGYYMEAMRHEEQERVAVLYLDSHLALIRSETLTIGTVNASLCSPRDIFRRALQAGAVNILLMHNHPSGDPTPSPEDFRLTEKVRRAGMLMDIPLVDHLIFGDLCYTSMKELGCFEEPGESAENPAFPDVDREEERGLSGWRRENVPDRNLRTADSSGTA